MPTLKKQYVLQHYKIIEFGLFPFRSKETSGANLTQRRDESWTFGKTPKG